jgi:hypothetical protein
VSGSVAAPGLRAASAYRFRSAAIEGRWTVSGARARAAHSGVTFPSWGRAAELVAELRDGRKVPVGSRPLALARVARLHIVSERSGYVVTPRTRPRGALVRRLRTARQDSAPNPGPTLEVSFDGRASLAVTIAVQGEEK